ncbi:MAG: amidohydrolase family protein, partial [Acidobacteriota bacterium]
MFLVGMALLTRLAIPEPARASGAALLLENATVYVSAESKPRKLAILAKEGRVVFVGDASRARKLAGDAKRIDLAGAYVFPGWTDAHGHLLGLGKSLEIANLRGAADSAEAARRISELAVKLPAGTWVEARGWDQNLWPGKSFPDARDLDAVEATRPVAARRVDGHALWVNTRALTIAGIGKETQDPDGGRILRRADGTPSG